MCKHFAYRLMGDAGVRTHHMDVSAYAGIYVLVTTSVSLFNPRSADSMKCMSVNESDTRT